MSQSSQKKENSTYQIRDNISVVYASLLPDFFKRPFPRENLCTCDYCIMVSEDKGNIGPEVRGSIHEYCIFHPDVKCCTYQPDLPNFLVGAILTTKGSDLSEGRKRINAKIMDAEGVTPESILATKSSSLEYNQLFDHASDCGSDIGCPYFNKAEKNCSIWSFRQANCSSFFCKSIEGIAGQLFWEAINFYLSGVEKKLSEYILKYSDLSTEAGMWQQNRAGFYIKAYAVVKGLERADFEKICGSSLDALLEQVQNTYAEATRRTVPPKLKTNPDLQTELMGNSKYRYDTGQGRCILSERLHTIVRSFDGKTNNEQVMEGIFKKQNVRLSSAWLLRLFKNKILVSSADEV